MRALGGIKALRMRWFIVAALITVSVSVKTQASEIRLTGADFEAACSKTDPDWISFCNGYVQAIIDANTDICPPSGTTRAQIVGAIHLTLRIQPALQKLNAAQVTHAILLSRFACQK